MVTELVAIVEEDEAEEEKEGEPSAFIGPVPAVAREEVQLVKPVLFQFDPARYVHSTVAACRLTKPPLLKLAG